MKIMEKSAADRGCTAGEKRQCYDWGYRDGANDMKNEIMATKATKADESVHSAAFISASETLQNMSIPLPPTKLILIPALKINKAILILILEKSL